jgi:hypothetical protein
MKIGASRLKQYPNQKKKNGSLKIYHKFCENM